MDDIGHLEFGALHQPIGFEGMDEVLKRFRAETVDYWIAYWVLAFNYILRHGDNVVLVSYAQLCQAGLTGVRTITTRLGIPHEMVQEFAGTKLRAPRSHNEGTFPADESLVNEANALYCYLSSMSIV